MANNYATWYKGILKANEYLLLGGVVEHHTSWYAYEEDARKLLDTMRAINLEAGRKPNEGRIESRVFNGEPKVWR